MKFLAIKELFGSFNRAPRSGKGSSIHSASEDVVAREQTVLLRDLGTTGISLATWPLSNPSRASTSPAAEPAAEAQHEASADVAHRRAGDDGQLARPLLPEDRLAGGAAAARAIADALQ